MTTPEDWVRLAREAFTGSTDYFNASIRNTVEQDLRQFQGLHPRGSKYMAEANKSRSRLFRPKTRTTIRKNEAVAAEAFFSTVDVVSVTAEDDDNKEHQASAAIMQTLLQYRLTKSVPWFLTLIGAYQDALTVGMVCSYQCWQYNAKKKIDKPMIKLLPIENLRFDPGADWTDPVNTSPYVIELIPMYIKDIKARMKTADTKTGESKWKPLADSLIQKAAAAYGDTTRLQREQGRTDSKDQNLAITDFSIVWVHKNIIEQDGEDFIYYTLGCEHLLSDPVPLESRYAHGKRPYVVGGAIIETHKNYWSGLPRISRDVQAEINDLANLRIDNVRFALSKRYFVKRNKQVDVRSLMRNVAGAATLMDDPESDVKVVEFNDVTSSSYQEQDRLNLDFDDVTGSFSGASVQSNRKLNETVGGMQLLDGSANQVSGYQLRTFVETWVQPVLRQVVMLEQYYETDDKVLALAGENAKLFERYGVSAVTDELLMQELTLNVNVGMGATSPTEQIQKFMQAMQALKVLLEDNVLTNYGLQVKEVIKELFGKLGYRDGGRFFDTKNQDPQVAGLMAQMQEMQKLIDQKESPELTAAKVHLAQAQAASAGTKDKNMDADTLAKIVAAMYSAMQAAEVVAAVPGVAPVADQIMVSAGYKDPNFEAGADGTGLGVETVKNKRTGVSFTPPGTLALPDPGNTHPNLPANPQAPANAPPAAATTPSAAGPTVGMHRGIETPGADAGTAGMADGGYVDPFADQTAQAVASAGGARLTGVQSGMAPIDIATSLRAHASAMLDNGFLSSTQTAALHAQADRIANPGWSANPGSARIGDNLFSSFANGGKVKGYKEGGMIQGPGSGTSDSVPAVVQPSGQKVAVSDGEFHVPKAVVDKVGLQFLQGLVQQYHTPVATGEPDPAAGDPLALKQGDFIIPADVVEALGPDFFKNLVEMNK